ncbi:MAG: circularly permuted type 2 ATP-grasp protein [Sphingomonadales bacterium]|nr:circularly permuted type 2 ATP-grasp protein [Sphingomonadales bacterium]
MQRAELSELLLADIYGPQRLVESNVLPTAALTGSPQFLRPMVGISPPGGHYLNIYAADLGRGPDGEWRVLADHTRSPAGAGYALENRLAASQIIGSLSERLNVARLAPFFADLRAGIAASCERSDPRLALLTPGRFNQSYAEQAHLARYLGVLLVEGADIAVHDDRVYLRTIEGLKRVDALLATHGCPSARPSGARFTVCNRRAGPCRRDGRRWYRHRQFSGVRGAGSARICRFHATAGPAPLGRAAPAAKHRDLVVRAGARSRTCGVGT